MAKLSLWQLVLSAFGAAFLLYTLKITRDSAIAATRAAKAAEDAVSVASDTAKRQLRAYLSATPHFKGDDPTKVRPVANIVIKNCGQTPAYKTRGWVDGVLGDYPLTGPLPINKKKPGASHVLAPGLDFTLNGLFRKTATNEIAAKVISGQMKYYFWGEVT